MPSCAACKCRRQKCTEDCVFSPFFPSENVQKFTNVHKVYGASNVSKLLSALEPWEREAASNSLAFEAECRIKDPIYGCAGQISLLQKKLQLVNNELESAKKELSTLTADLNQEKISTAQMAEQEMIQYRSFQQRFDSRITGYDQVQDWHRGMVYEHDQLLKVLETVTAELQSGNIGNDQQEQEIRIRSAVEMVFDAAKSSIDHRIPAEQKKHIEQSIRNTLEMGAAKLSLYYKNRNSYWKSEQMAPVFSPPAPSSHWQQPMVQEFERQNRTG